MKILVFNSYPVPVYVGQLVVWDAEQVLSQHKDAVQKTLTDKSPDWFINIVSVGEEKTTF